MKVCGKREPSGDGGRVKRTHELFMKQRRWRVKENIERRLGENVILRTRQVDDGGVRPYQRERERERERE